VRSVEPSESKSPAADGRVEDGRKPIVDAESPREQAAPDAGGASHGMAWHGSFMLGATVAALLANLATGILIARSLGTSGRGELAAIAAAPQLMAWLFTLGCREAVTFHQARHPEDAGRLATTWAVLFIPISAIAVGCGLLLLPFLFAAQTESAYRLAQVYMFMTAVFLLTEVALALAIGDEDFIFYNAMRVLLPVITAVGYVALWFTGGLTVGTALAVLAGAACVTTIAAWRRAAKRHGLRRPDIGLGRSTLWYGMRAHGTGLGSIINVRLDLTLMPAFLSAVSVGLYSVATNLAWIVISVSGFLYTLILPAAARAGASAGDIVRRALHVTMATGLALALPLGVLANLLVPAVYGSDFDGSVFPLRILLPGCVLYAGAAVLWSGLYALDRPLSATLAQMAGVVITLIGLPLLLPIGGIVAAAWVSLASYVIVFCTAAALYVRAGGAGWRELIPRPAVIKVDTAAAIGALSRRRR